MVGAAFRLTRSISGFDVVPNLCQAIREGVDYPLIGCGEKWGVLGIGQAQICVQEAALAAIGLDLAFLAGLWLKFGTQVSEKTL